MTFRLVGITAEGKRILRFDHDRTRRHSPIIDRMGEIYIVENKSVAAYLRQLEKMGEDAEVTPASGVTRTVRPSRVSGCTSTLTSRSG